MVVGLCVIGEHVILKYTEYATDTFSSHSVQLLNGVRREGVGFAFCVRDELR